MQDMGVGSHFSLQGIFLIQGMNPGLPHCKQILYHLSHLGSPLINLAWELNMSGHRVLQVSQALVEDLTDFWLSWWDILKTQIMG